MPKVCVFLALLFSTACGYHVVRADRLFGGRDIAVVPFYETTAVGLAAPMAAHLSRLLQADGMRVTPARQQAQTVLNGRIQLSTTPSATRAGIQAYQLVATVHACLTDAQGKPVWRRDTTVKEDFLPTVGTDVQPLTTEANRRFAIHRLAERAARQVHEGLVLSTLSWDGV